MRYKTNTIYRELGLEQAIAYRIQTRMHNSPYFCVFKYARAVKQKVSNEAENSERDWGETPKIRFFFSCHTLPFLY